MVDEHSPVTISESELPARSGLGGHALFEVHADLPWDVFRVRAKNVTLDAIEGGWLPMRYVLLLTLVAKMAAAASIDPKRLIQLSWATQTSKQGGGVYPDFSLFSLSCVLGECTLIEARLNRCFGSGPDAFFTPELRSWATLDGTLQIRIEDAAIGVSYETSGWAHHHRLGVKTDEGDLMEIVSYIGDAMHDARPESMTYAIVRNGTMRKFDCKAHLPGLSAAPPTAQQKPPRKTP